MLYNLALARQAAHDTGELVVTEGYMDVIAMSQAGFPAAVAPLGTAVTELQVGELWRLVPEPVICLDGDPAGRRAAFRTALTALPGLLPDRSLRFALLPAGEDPDSLVNSQGPEALRKALDRALSLSDVLWLMDTEGRDLATPERQAGLWQALHKRIGEIRSPEVQNAYRQAMEQRFETAFRYNPLSGRRVFSARRHGLGRPTQGGLPAWRKAPRGGAGPLAVPGTGRGVRQAPERLRRRQEQVLLATVVNHPEILAEHAENLTDIELAGADLRRFAQALVDAVASAPDLDTEALKRHLCDQGFSKLLEELLSRRIYVHGGFARPETPLAEARVKWTNFLALHRQRQADTETAKAARLLAEDTSEERLAWLQARQRSAEGGESRRVEFDSPKSVEVPESS